MSQRLAKPDQHGPKDLEQIYKEIYEQAVRTSARRLPNGEGYDAEDLVQDKFLAFIKKGVSFEGIEDPKNYVLKSMKHAGIDKIKRKSRLTAENSFSVDQPKNDEEQRQQKELPDPRRSPEMNAQVKEENEIYERMLEAASSDLDKCERLLLDSRRDGLSNDEIAIRLGKNVEDIRKEMNALMAKIRHRVRQLLKKNSRFQH